MANIVVDIGGSGARFGIVTEVGVAGVQRENVHSFEALVSAITMRAETITGVALSVPGFVLGDEGVVLKSVSNPYLEGNLKEKLLEKFPKAKIFVVNDGEAHALALRSVPKVKFPAINIAIGTGVAFGVLDEKQNIIRTLANLNWEIGDLCFEMDKDRKQIWETLGENGIAYCQEKYGKMAYQEYGKRLGEVATQLAILFNPSTIGFSGGFVARYWHEMESAVLANFHNPTEEEVTLIGQKDVEPALVGLSTLF